MPDLANLEATPLREANTDAKCYGFLVWPGGLVAANSLIAFNWPPAIWC